ncbi:hypothetical protein GCM10022389_08880 [Flavobacterium cheonanense]|uniref:Peptidase S74 domain-containing protein n=1 Tax=Flavobacterium cheonanense TaxID=706183 RepID=A0ABP7VFZ0_9FLAO
MKKIYIQFIFIFFTFGMYSQVGVNTTNPTATLHVFGNTTLPSGGTTTLLNQNFNTNDFTFLNSGTATNNNWRYGSAAGNPSSAIYISNDNGITNNYATTSTATVTFAYRDVAIPTGTTTSTFSFDWRCNGERTVGTDYDYFRVWLTPTSFTPTLGTQITAGAGRIQVGTNFNQQNTWTTFSNAALNVSSFAGSSMRIIYEWRNDSSGGNQFPAAIDNVIVTIPSTPVPGTYAFRLEDGTQGVGKVLTSDANGNGYWQTASGGSGTDSQTLSISGSTLSISNGNSVTLPSGSGTYTFTNGLTNTAGTVRLGGTLTQATTLNLDSYDLNFNSNTSVAFPGQIKFNGANRVMMETNFASDYISFGGGSTLVDGDDGLTFVDSGGDTYTRDFALGFYKGASGGSAMATGSIEYIVDGLDELLLEASSLNPLVDNDTRLGGSSKRWTAVWATNGTIQTSDMKLKKDVVELKYGLKEVMQLNPISYKWKSNRIGKTAIPDQLQETKLGFSAQQLLDVLPEVVETHSWYPKDEEGNFERKQNENLGVRYAEITPVIVKAIQEQQEQIESLKVTVEELKKQNEILLKLLEKK